MSQTDTAAEPTAVLLERAIAESRQLAAELASKAQHLNVKLSQVDTLRAKLQLESEQP